MSRHFISKECLFSQLENKFSKHKCPPLKAFSVENFIQTRRTSKNTPLGTEIARTLLLQLVLTTVDNTMAMLSTCCFEFYPFKNNTDFRIPCRICYASQGNLSMRMCGLNELLRLSKLFLVLFTHTVIGVKLNRFSSYCANFKGAPLCNFVPL